MRILVASVEGLTNYELLEFLLFSARSRDDTKLLAKARLIPGPYKLRFRALTMADGLAGLPP